MSNETRRDEGEKAIPLPAIRIADSSDDVLQGILDVYDEVAYGHVRKDEYGMRLVWLRQIVSDYQRHQFNPGELRLGATGTPHSKLWTQVCHGSFSEDVIAFSYDPNIGRNERGFAEGETKNKRFSKKNR
jgi:hypothetical protein